MSKFKVGDKVVGNQQMACPTNVGRHATVVNTQTGCNPTIRWDDNGMLAFTVSESKLDAVSASPSALPTDSAERKRWPLYSGLLAYFPAALAQVAHHSFLGNEKHNPGLPLQHARGVSGDHQDCILRHLVDAMEHPTGSAQRVEELRALCWRGLALLQEESELSGAPAAPAASFDRVKK